MRAYRLVLIIYTKFSNFVGFNGPHLTLCGSATVYCLVLTVTKYEEVKHERQTELKECVLYIDLMCTLFVI